MSTIRCIYHDAPPNFPATDQHPDAVRYKVGNVWVDAIGGQPTQAEIDAILNPPPASDPVGFSQAIKTALGGIVAANALMRAYPAFYDAVATQTWPDVQALIIDAKTTGALTAQQYAGFQALAVQFHIPIVLP